GPAATEARMDHSSAAETRVDRASAAEARMEPAPAGQATTPPRLRAVATGDRGAHVRYHGRDDRPRRAPSPTRRSGRRGQAPLPGGSRAIPARDSLRPPRTRRAA